MRENEKTDKEYRYCTYRGTISDINELPENGELGDAWEYCPFTDIHYWYIWTTANHWEMITTTYSFAPNMRIIVDKAETVKTLVTLGVQPDGILVSDNDIASIRVYNLHNYAIESYSISIPVPHIDASDLDVLGIEDIDFMLQQMRHVHPKTMKSKR